jgi:uncharacterized protein (TIGR02246 family)
MNWLLIVSLLFVTGGFAQSNPPGVSDQFANLDFASGAVGDLPSGWRLGAIGASAYTAQIAPAAMCHGGKQCGMLGSVGLGPHDRCFLYQNVDAALYRNKVLVFGAASRVTGGGLARLVVRVRRQDDSTTFYNNLGDHPIQSAEWSAYQIVFPIDADAKDIEFGIQLHGKGAAWIDQIYLSSPIIEAEKEIRKLFAEFNAARDGIDGHAMAQTYSETGEYISLWGARIAGRSSLEQLWGSVSGKSRRTIHKIDVLTPDMAVVSGNAEFENPDERPELEEVFVLVKERDGWKIRVHQAMRP